jgi:hypothetical protein
MADYEFAVYSVGLCYASVCTSLTVEEAAQRLNIEHPTGIGPWQIDPEGVFASGAPNPCKCHDFDTHQHMLFSC